MGTNIRPEIRQNDEYYIPKERYYELKHFCLQYPFWKKQYAWAYGKIQPSMSFKEHIKSSDPADETARLAILMDRYDSWITMVESAADKADPELKDYILESVTKGRSYSTILATHGIAISKAQFYKAYRKFFWILSHVREDWNSYKRDRK